MSREAAAFRWPSTGLYPQGRVPAACGSGRGRKLLGAADVASGCERRQGARYRRDSNTQKTNNTAIKYMQGQARDPSQDTSVVTWRHMRGDR